MKILGLSNNNCAIPLWDWLKEEGHEVTVCSERLTEQWCKEQNFDLAVSYTYKYILPESVLLALKENVVNIHNSFLPFNRGASPNIWSFVEGTPRGVTLHFMDAGLDKGYIIAQRLVTEGDGETLTSSYENLNVNAIELFKDAFKYYEHWQEMKKVPEGKGTYHSVKDTEKISEYITSYDMKIDDFLKALKEHEK